MSKKISIVIISIVVIATGLFVNYVKYFAKAEKKATNTIVSKANLYYSDSQGQDKTVDSNIVNIAIKDTLAPADFTFDISGWYLFSLAKKPADGVTVADIFGSMDINNNLYRWDTFNQKMISYDVLSALGDFGNTIDTGAGFWVDHSTGAMDSISYTGTEETLPKIIDLNTSSPDGGWAIVGNPYNKIINTETNILFIKGGAEKSWTDAVAAEWVECTGYKWDSENKGLVDVGPDGCWTSTTNLEANHGMWVQLKVDGVSVKFIP